MDVNKVQALSTLLLAMSVLQHTDKTFVNREIVAVMDLVREELEIKK
ncbi:hypothetical protein KIS4809_4649 [Bacillus sp. ZZV12-4809]|nr:hypothetical protein KIS4809_4649 [Bacillus sp. ZZV12-4809]